MRSNADMNGVLSSFNPATIGSTKYGPNLPTNGKNQDKIMYMLHGEYTHKFLAWRSTPRRATRKGNHWSRDVIEGTNTWGRTKDRLLGLPFLVEDVGHECRKGLRLDLSLLPKAVEVESEGQQLLHCDHVRRQTW